MPWCNWRSWLVIFFDKAKLPYDASLVKVLLSGCSILDGGFCWIAPAAGTDRDLCLVEILSHEVSRWSNEVEASRLVFSPAVFHRALVCTTIISLKFLHHSSRHSCSCVCYRNSYLAGPLNEISWVFHYTGWCPSAPALLFSCTPWLTTIVLINWSWTCSS